MTIEEHPLVPFLPANGKILFLGSFPPPKARWSMEFFYPNWINDFSKVGEFVSLNENEKSLRWWRMPSSSRAYPMKLEKKAEYYRLLFE